MNKVKCVRDHDDEEVKAVQCFPNWMVVSDSESLLKKKKMF